MQQLILAVFVLASAWVPSRWAVSSVTVAPDTLALAYGDRGLLVATCRNAYDAVIYCVGGIRWTVRDTSKVLRITTSGSAVEARGRATGTTWVVAKPLIGTSDSSKVVVTSSPPGPQPPTPPPTVASIAMTPTTATVASGATQAFTVQGFTSTGVPLAVSPTFSATGGSISGGGVYTAGGTAGPFRAIATVGSLADTSAITIPTIPPTLVSVTLSPSSAALATGGASQQFTTTGTYSDASTATVTPTYTPTGGTISAGGLYASGSTAGSFTVIASFSGKADTSAVTLTTPTPPPTGCVRTVAVTTTATLNSALNVAAPGDCINLASGTYSRTSALTLNRSGTAAQPITIQGTGASSTILNFGGSALYIQASYLRIRKVRLTNFGVQALWHTGATYNILDSLELDHALQALIRWKDGSHHNTVKNSLLRDTGAGVHPEWGEAIYVGNSGDASFPLQFTNTDNQILDNHFGPDVRSQAVDVKEGSDRTVIKGNTIDGTGTQDIMSAGSVALIDVIASNVVIDDNDLQYGSPQGIVFWGPQTVTMTGNLVTNNTIDLQNIHGVNFATRKFYGFNRSSGTTSSANVVVKCNNTVTNGAFSNVACVP